MSIAEDFHFILVNTHAHVRGQKIVNSVRDKTKKSFKREEIAAQKIKRCVGDADTPKKNYSATT